MSKKNLILIGTRFARLTVLHQTAIIEKNGASTLAYECRCDCGKHVIVRANSLRKRFTRSCGCIRIETSTSRQTIHGQSKGSSTYRSWASLRQRCENQTTPNYHRYGGRGIKVCDRWLESFENFLQDMGEKPSPKHTIDRIDNNGNYEPSNCRWATRMEQARNTRRNRIITFKGVTGCVTELAEKFGVDPDLVWTRIAVCHWPVDKAFTEPSRQA